MKLQNHAWLPLALVGVITGFLIASCGDSPSGGSGLGTKRDSGGGAPISSDAGESLGCPAESPKVGERCPSGVGVSDKCTFPDGTCVRGGVTYDDFADFCCPVGFWERCGGGSEACMRAPDPERLDAAGADGATGDGGSGDGRSGDAS